MVPHLDSYRAFADLGLTPGTGTRPLFGEARRPQRLAVIERPVLAWAGRAPDDFGASALRYVIGASLPAFTGPAAPSARMVGKRDLAAVGLATSVVCPEACTVAATGAAYALRQEDAESAAATAYARLGSLTGAHASLSSAGHKVLRLRLARDTRKRFCTTARRGDHEAVEVNLAIHTSARLERHLVLGEEPTQKGCQH